VDTGSGKIALMISPALWEMGVQMAVAMRLFFLFYYIVVLAFVFGFYQGEFEPLLHPVTKA